jgi:large subunit ribosomal protein L29
MKAGELRDLNDKTLREHISTQRRDLFGLRLQHATGELENTAGMRSVKRDLARARHNGRSTRCAGNDACEPKTGDRRGRVRA